MEKHYFVVARTHKEGRKGPGELWTYTLLGLSPRLWFSKSKVGTELWVSVMFPDDAVSRGPIATLWTPLD
jgi:hypothetical protein